MPTRAHYTRPTGAEEECYQRTTLRTAKLHLPATQLHPGLTILQGERETFFFFFKQRVSQGGVSIQLNMDVWEALNRENPQETGLRLAVITLFCADRLTLFPEKINGYFEQFHTRHLMHTVSSQIWRLQYFTGTKRERERKRKEK